MCWWRLLYSLFYSWERREQKHEEVGCERWERRRHKREKILDLAYRYARQPQKEEIPCEWSWWKLEGVGQGPGSRMVGRPWKRKEAETA